MEVAAPQNSDKCPTSTLCTWKLSEKLIFKQTVKMPPFICHSNHNHIKDTNRTISCHIIALNHFLCVLL